MNKKQKQKKRNNNSKQNSTIYKWDLLLIDLQASYLSGGPLIFFCESTCLWLFGEIPQSLVSSDMLTHFILYIQKKTKYAPYITSFVRLTPKKTENKCKKKTKSNKILFCVFFFLIRRVFRKLKPYQ